jgi:predicted ATPase
VPYRVAAALDVQESAIRPLAQTLADALRHSALLLVLDNCEHLLDACAVLTDVLLRECPKLQILATSREPIGISGEVADP